MINKKLTSTNDPQSGELFSGLGQLITRSPTFSTGRKNSILPFSYGDEVGPFACLKDE